MSRQLKPLSHRRGFHRPSRWQRRRISVLIREMAVMNMCARLYVARKHAPTMLVQDVLTDIRPKYKRLRTELEGLRGLSITHLLSPQLVKVLFNPPKF